MTIEVKIEKVENGYIVTPLNYTGRKQVFKTFAEMSEFLFTHFEERTDKS